MQVVSKCTKKTYKCPNVRRKRTSSVQMYEGNVQVRLKNYDILIGNSKYKKIRSKKEG